MNNTKEFAYLRGAISCTLNALDRDGEAGQPVRKEMADELRLAFGNFIEVSERATPAAASAGAAGTIDTPYFRELLVRAGGNVENLGNTRHFKTLFAHIDQHTAAAVANERRQWEAENVVLVNELKLAAERERSHDSRAQEAIEKLMASNPSRAATAPVSAAPTYADEMAGFEDRYRSEYNYMEGEEIRNYGHHDCAARWWRLGREIPQSAGAPVSAAATFIDVRPEPMDFTMTGNAVNVDCTVQIGQHGEPRRIVVSSPEGLPAAFDALRADPPPPLEVLHLNAGRFYGDADDSDDDVDSGEQLPTTYRLCAGWECARMEPDPAGEWVKRADLAMGQQGDAEPVDASGDTLADYDRILRSSVPDRYKGCTSPIGAVQNYIVELEQRLEQYEPDWRDNEWAAGEPNLHGLRAAKDIAQSQGASIAQLRKDLENTIGYSADLKPGYGGFYMRRSDVMTVVEDFAAKQAGKETK